MKSRMLFNVVIFNVVCFFSSYLSAILRFSSPTSSIVLKNDQSSVVFDDFEQVKGFSRNSVLDANYAVLSKWSNFFRQNRDVEKVIKKFGEESVDSSRLFTNMTPLVLPNSHPDYF